MMLWFFFSAFLQASDPPASDPPPSDPQDAGLPAGVSMTSPAAPDPAHVNVLGLASTSGADYQPLNGHERWRFFLNSTVASPGAFAPVVATSLVAQLRLEPPEWDDHFDGYGKRLLSAFGTNIVQGVIQSSGNALLKTDPRYIRSAQPGFWHRAGHAVLFTTFTYNEHGKARPGIANLASFYGSNIIAVLWYPPGHHAVSEGVKTANIQMGLNLGFNVLQEFWPDIKRAFVHKSR